MLAGLEANCGSCMNGKRDIVLRLRDNAAKTHHSMALRREAAAEISALRTLIKEEHLDRMNHCGCAVCKGVENETAKDS